MLILIKPSPENLFLASTCPGLRGEKASGQQPLRGFSSWDNIQGWMKRGWLALPSAMLGLLRGPTPVFRKETQIFSGFK